MLGRIVFVFLVFCTCLSTSYAQRTEYDLNANKVFKEGISLINKTQYGLAQQRMRTYVSRPDADPLKIVEAEYYIAISAMYLNQPQAERLLIEWENRNKRHPKAHLVSYELGKYYYKRSKFKKASQWLAKVDLTEITDRSERYEVTFDLGYSYFQIKDIEKAEKCFDAVKGFDHNFTYAANYYSGYIKFKKKDFKQAVTDFQVAGDNDRYASVVPFMILNIYYQMGNFDKVISYGTEVLKEKKGGKKTKDIILICAESAFYEQKFKESFEWYQVFISSKGRLTREGFYKFGFSAFRQGEFGLASSAFEKVASTEDTLTQNAWYYKGHSDLNINDFNSAMISFENAAKYELNNDLKADAIFNLGKLQYEQGFFKKAVRTLKTYKKDNPKSPFKVKVDELIAECLLNSDDLSEALKYIEGLPIKNNRIKGVYEKVAYLKGIEFFNKRKYAASEELLTNSISINKDQEVHIKALYWRAENKSIRSRWSEASSDYAQVLKSTKASADLKSRSRYGIGYCYFNLKDLAKAQKNFEAYVKETSDKPFDPYFSDALTRLGDCNFRNKKYETAITFYQRVLDRRVKAGDFVLYQMGRINVILTKYELAQENFDRIIADYPNSAYRGIALYTKGSVSNMAQDYTGAVKHYTAFIEGAPGHELTSQAFLERGISNVNTRDFEAAKEDYVKVLIEYCNSAQAGVAITKLQRVLKELNKEDDYGNYLDNYVACSDDKDVENIYFETAKNQFHSFNFDKAIDGFKNYSNKFPQGRHLSRANYFIGESFFNLDQKDSAAVYFSKYADAGIADNLEDVLVNLNIIYLEQGDYERSIKYAKRVLQLSNDPILQLNVQTDLMEALYRNGNYVESEEMADLILKQENKVIWAGVKAKLYKGKALIAQNKNAEGRKWLTKVVQKTSGENAAEAYYEHGKSLANDSLFQNSIDTLVSLQKKYLAYPKWVGRGTLLIAQNYLNMGEVNLAKSVLQSLEEHGTEEFKKEAHELLEEIEKKLAEQQELMEVAPTDTIELDVEPVLEEEESEE